ncbi:hypothetical protein R3P38DRAFT_3199123 [Favolaschia claudopus]|uniref:Uncharacterized protein n=1 Tax=Favolaschia claudopus TaxID=2862362 RepID=A0AAW0B2W8_9AGAR
MSWSAYSHPHPHSRPNAALIVVIPIEFLRVSPRLSSSQISFPAAHKPMHIRVTQLGDLIEAQENPAVFLFGIIDSRRHIHPTAATTAWASKLFRMGQRRLFLSASSAAPTSLFSYSVLLIWLAVHSHNMLPSSAPGWPLLLCYIHPFQRFRHIPEFNNSDWVLFLFILSLKYRNTCGETRSRIRIRIRPSIYLAAFTAGTLTVHLATVTVRPILTFPSSTLTNYNPLSPYSSTPLARLAPLQSFDFAAHRTARQRVVLSRFTATQHRVLNQSGAAISEAPLPATAAFWSLRCFDAVECLAHTMSLPILNDLNSNNCILTPAAAPLVTFHNSF